MNLKQLSKNVGQLLRVRPKAKKVDSAGRHLEILDDHWCLEGIYAKPNRIALLNIHTNRSVELQSDNIKQFQSPDFLILRCQLTLTPSEVEIEPLPPTGRQILPIARYQVKGKSAIFSQYIPLRPVTCDGCTVAVQFRPLTRVQLMSKDDPPELPEQFCPPCARKRGISVSPPGGMKDSILFAHSSPSFRYHLSRTLKHWGLKAFATDSDLQAVGVTKIGGIITAQSITLMVTGNWPDAIEVPLPLHELETALPESDHALLAAVKTHVITRLGTKRR